MGPHEQMQTIMVRGLYSRFKQPIFIDFDTKVTRELLISVCTKLSEVDLNVVGTVCDNGGGNVGLWSDLGVSYLNTTMTHPITAAQIFMFSDAPHLLKLLRNWFIDGGFLLEDGTELNQAYIRKLLEVNPEISSIYNVSLKHLTVVGTERQNVRMACQLFSHKVAKALLKHFASDEVARKLANFIELVNNWFDTMNSYSLSGIGYKKPYGLALDEQDAVLGI